MLSWKITDLAFCDYLFVWLYPSQIRAALVPLDFNLRLPISVEFLQFWNVLTALTLSSQTLILRYWQVPGWEKRWAPVDSPQCHFPALSFLVTQVIGTLAVLWGLRKIVAVVPILSSFDSVPLWLGWSNLNRHGQKQRSWPFHAGASTPTYGTVPITSHLEYGSNFTTGQSAFTVYSWQSSRGEAHKRRVLRDLRGKKHTPILQDPEWYPPESYYSPTPLCSAALASSLLLKHQVPCYIGAFTSANPSSLNVLPSHGSWLIASFPSSLCFLIFPQPGAFGSPHWILLYSFPHPYYWPLSTITWNSLLILCIAFLSI